jgi:LysR family hydrogen peroxide-inducible transcriptional activator
MSLTLQQLRFLVAIADTLHFSQAADLCHVTQPTLSAGLRALEDQLGVQLVERTTRQVMLTSLGQDISERARKVLQDVSAIERLAAASLNPDEGDLRMGSIPTVGPFLLPPLLPRLRDAFPRLRIYLREELTDSLIEGVGDGRLDVALIALPYDTGNLRVLPLFDDGYHLAAQRDADAPRLEAGRLMLLEPGHCLQRHALRAYPGRRLDRDDSFAATSLGTLVSMVGEGLGITLLPDLAVRAGLAEQEPVRLTPLPDACPRTVALVWRPGTARVELFEGIGALLQKVNERLGARGKNGTITTVQRPAP